MKPKISTGALFRNQYRTKPTSPEFTGVLNIDPSLLPYLARKSRSQEEMKCFLSAWQNTSADGTRYLTVTIQEYREARRKTAAKEPDFLCD